MRHSGIDFEDGDIRGDGWTCINIDGRQVMIMNQGDHIDLHAPSIRLGAAEALELAAELRAWAMARIVPDKADLILADRRSKRWRWCDEFAQHKLGFGSLNDA